MTHNETRCALELDWQQLQAIRRALITGLTCYGEIERINNAVKLAELCKKEIPEGVHVVDPTGDAETVSKFAEALSYLEQARLG